LVWGTSETIAEMKGEILIFFTFVFVYVYFYVNKIIARNGEFQPRLVRKQQGQRILMMTMIVIAYIKCLKWHYTVLNEVMQSPMSRGATVFGL
jgi:hypothetical protein